MERNEIAQRVLEMLAGKVGKGREISLDSSVIADTGLDSVSVMDFVFELEDEFGITVPLDRISDVKTVGQLTDAVYGLIEEAA